MIETHGKLLISGFIAILIGVVLITPIGNDIENVKISSRTLLNESVTISSGLGTLTFDELISFDSCRNSSMDNIFSGGDCNVTTATGEVSVTPANFSDGLAFIGYTYEPDSYVHSGTARTLISLTTLFFAIAIMTVGAGLVFAGLKQGGMF